jgi:hypothetical protein
MPLPFADPAEVAPPGTTRIQVYVGPGTPFEGPNGRAIAEFTTGLGRTILLVEGPEPVPWTKPMDLPFGPEVTLVRPFSRGIRPRCAVVSVDEYRWIMPADTPEEGLRALVSRNGGKAE